MKTPEHVAILGLGSSLNAYIKLIIHLGGRRVYSDETWGVNTLADLIQCDRIFHMDDVRVQEMRAENNPDGNIARTLSWLRDHPGPVYTSIVRENCPNFVAFPLEDVLNSGYESGAVPYFNNTVAYAVAFAIHIGVKQISMFGCDYTYANAHHAEQGRACTEYWLGVAAARGILITVPEQSTLLDACAKDAERLYGYDLTDVHFLDDGKGKLKVEHRELAVLPTAEQIEKRYDHSQHPNRLLNGRKNHESQSHEAVQGPA